MIRSSRVVKRQYTKRMYPYVRNVHIVYLLYTTDMAIVWQCLHNLSYYNINHIQCFFLLSLQVSKVKVKYSSTVIGDCYAAPCT